MLDKPFTSASYEQFLNEEKLMGSRCKKCGSLFLPPRPICIECHGREMEWVQIRGKGKLAAFACIAVGAPCMLSQGYDRQHPYCSGVVELEEGVRIDARIEGMDVTHPETIKIGSPLAVEFFHRGEGDNLETFLVFRLSSP